MERKEKGRMDKNGRGKIGREREKGRMIEKKRKIEGKVERKEETRGKL